MNTPETWPSSQQHQLDGGKGVRAEAGDNPAKLLSKEPAFQ